MSLADVAARVDAALARSGRTPGSVTIVAVSKGRPPTEVMALYDQGHRDFGENRADELAEKSAQLPSDIRWHFVGHLQSNKARAVRPTAYLLHSMDRLSLAKAWLKGSGSPPPALLQVNIGREAQKSGVDPSESVAVASRIAALGVPLAGVMAILPIVAEPEEARPYFHEMLAVSAQVAAEVPTADQVSMGMTHDFEVAVEEGATLIRVGRAIFDVGHNP